MKAALPAAIALLAWIAPSARAAGVVGTGTPESCTEAALATALTGGGTVTFDCGSAVAVIPFTTEHVLDSTTTLDGGDLVQLDGQNTTRLFRVPDAAAPLTVTFRDITLQFGRCPSTGPGANAGGAVWAGANVRVEVLSGFLFGNRCGAAGAEIGGGAVYVRGGSVTLDQVDAASNGATDGGSIHAVDSTILVDRSFFVAIPNGRRGGAVFATGGAVTLRRSAILASAATGGGAGLYATGSASVTIEDSLLSNGNATGAAGGGLHQQGGTLSIQRATFDSNRADQGGAVHVSNVVLDVANTTFRGNRAVAGRGGAIRLAAANAGVIAHSTFAENRASAGAGAVSSDASSTSAAVQLRASILEDNATASPASSSCDGVLASGGFNFQSPGVAGDGDCVAGIARVSPQLGPLALPNGGFLSVFPLLPTSPARDVVTSGCPPPATDQLGITRPFGPACDSGAVEFAPVITIDDVVVTEGTGGTTPATFTLRLSQPSPDPVTVSSATMDGTAVLGEDYGSGGGTILFGPGETQATMTVTVYGDAIMEPAETFRLVLSNPENASIGGTGIGTARIDDDDVTPPVLSVSDCHASEGDSCRFVVEASSPSGFPMTFSFGAAPGTATPGLDYQTFVGSATLPPGTDAFEFEVPLVDDTEDETAETFSFQISAPQNATIGDGIGEGVIHDNDGPTATVGAGTVVEGDAGTTQMVFPLTLSAPSPETVVVQYAPLPNSGNAIAGVDYVEGTNTVTFPPGSVSQGAAVGVLGDLVDEPTERFLAAFNALAGGTVAAGSERVGATIVDDDGGPFELRELSHGVSFRSDLVGGADFFLVASAPFTTWEVVVDEASGDLGDGVGPAVERVGLDLQTAVQASVPVGVGPARSLRLPAPGGLGAEMYVRVSSATCGTACGPDDTYRIRAYETTLRAPRYNCTGGQASVLVLQNRGDVAVEATTLGFGATGLEQGGQTLTVGPRATQVFPLCTVLPDRSGSLIVFNDGAYDQLAGKIVALEPATGLAFDTPLEPRRR